MIRSYRDKRTRDFADGKRVKAFDGISQKASMKLDQLHAAIALGKIGDPSAVETLRKALGDPDKAVTDAARKALKKVGPAPA